MEGGPLSHCTKAKRKQTEITLHYLFFDKRWRARSSRKKEQLVTPKGRLQTKLCASKVGTLRWTFALLIKSTLFFFVCAKCHPVRLQNCTWNSAISDVGRQQLAMAREPPSEIRAHPGSPVNFRRATWKQYVKQGWKLPVDLYVCGWKSSAKLIRHDAGLNVAKLVYFAVKINVYLRWLRNWWLRSSLPFLITGKFALTNFELVCPLVTSCLLVNIGHLASFCGRIRWN